MACSPFSPLSRLGDATVFCTRRSVCPDEVGGRQQHAYAFNPPNLQVCRTDILPADRADFLLQSIGGKRPGCEPQYHPTRRNHRRHVQWLLFGSDRNYVVQRSCRSSHREPESGNANAASPIQPIGSIASEGSLEAGRHPGAEINQQEPSSGGVWSSNVSSLCCPDREYGRGYRESASTNLRCTVKPSFGGQGRSRSAGSNREQDVAV